jgi:ribosomal protein S18 acetylase RimI-like enzyme
MFIKKPWRGKGYGKLLLELSLKASEKMDYEKVRLDTLDYMAAAIHTYRQAGFYEIPPYRHNPFQNAVFMEKQL